MNIDSKFYLKCPGQLQSILHYFERVKLVPLVQLGRSTFTNKGK